MRYSMNKRQTNPRFGMVMKKAGIKEDQYAKELVGKGLPRYKRRSICKR